MTMFLQTVLLFCLFLITNAQVFSLGKCPTVKTQDPFDINKYLGDWYEIYKFEASFEGQQRCIRANYQMKEDGHIRVQNTGIEDGKSITAIGDGYAPDKNVPAKLEVRFSDKAPYGKYWVLDTDYENYTFIYSCTDLAGLSHIEFAWILSRTRTLDDKYKTKLYDLATSFGIKTSNFQTEDQTGCS
ncbi:apolipoprotein D-like [Crassostrea virginica]|uniref:Apolipoprotein D n=1 Tax=Crassostrea virginica TaxID=6565 RepID=A0A8B8EYC3_CRAVI|nr:apolipoprotein D-like [Crassostrea virginica]